MTHNRGRSNRMDYGSVKGRRKEDTASTNKSFITGIIIFILMLVSAAGPVGIVLLFVFGVFAFIIGVMYFVLKSQKIDPNNPKSAKDIKIDIMRTIREKSEKEGDPMFNEGDQNRSLTREDYARLEHCSHEESLKSLLDAGIIDRAEYVDRMRELNCSSAH